MIVSLLLLICSAFSFDYQVGETFSYTYSSHVDVSAVGNAVSSDSSVIDVTCTATFSVLSVIADGVYMSLTVSNFNGKVSGAKSSDLFGDSEAVDLYLSNPLYFKFKKDGTITDVVANKADSEAVLNIKTAVAFSISTHFTAIHENEYQQDTVIDTLGKHYEYSSVTNGPSSRTVNTFFSEGDFVYFADRNMDSQSVTVDSRSSHVIANDKVTSANSEMTLVLNKKNSQSPNGAEIQIIASGSSVLSDFKALPTRVVDPASQMTTIASFLTGNRGYALVNKFRSAYYLHNFNTAPAHSSVVSDDGCPGNINFCKSVDGSWTVGDTNIGLYIHTWALAGVTLGCTEAHRSYMAGAYADLNILILQHNITAVDAYIEYGQVDGITQRNAISLSLFGESLYYQAIPYLNCITQDYPLANWDKEYRFPYDTQVYIVTLTFYVSVKVNLSATVTVKICPMEFNASVSLIPKAVVTLGGGAEATVVIAKAGINLSGSTTDYLNPTAYVDGNLCRVGFYAYNTFSGITASLVGYYQVFDLRTFIKTHEITWRTKHEYPLWSYNLPGRVDKIIDVYWGATTD